MRGWSQSNLGSCYTEILDGDRGKNYPSKSELLPVGACLFLNAGNVTKDGFNFGTCEFVSKDRDSLLRKGKLQRHDCVLTTRGTVGNVAYYGAGVPYDDIRINSGMVIIRADQQFLDPRYLAFFLRSDDFSDQVKGLTSGSAQPQLPIRDLRQVVMPVPPLPEQCEIAAILGALDDKIEVNRKASATLEEMARALYRSWFVDFDPVHARVEGRAPAHMDPATAALFPDSFGDNGLPEGWEFGRLADLAIQSKNSVKPEKIDPETPYIGLEHMPRRSIALNQWGTAGDVGSQKSAIRTGDFMFGKLRPYFHKVGVSPVNGICSTDIIVLRPITDEWSGLVLSVISSDEFVEHTNAGSAGTRMPRTKWADMGAYKIPVPPVAVGAAFEKLVKPWRDRIIGGIHENQTLAALRDALLPKLMSGEIRVEAARARIEEIA